MTKVETVYSHDHPVKGYACPAPYSESVDRDQDKYAPDALPGIEFTHQPDQTLGIPKYALRKKMNEEIKGIEKDLAELGQIHNLSDWDQDRQKGLEDRKFALIVERPKIAECIPSLVIDMAFGEVQVNS